MRAILEFNLPEESVEHSNAVHGRRAFACLEDVREMFRRYRKYEDLQESERSFCDKLETEFFEIVDGVLE